MKKIISFITAVLMTLCTSGAVYAEDEKFDDLTYCTLLMEASTGTVLSQENGYERVPQGTLSKLMTVLLAAEEIESGNLSTDTKLTASANANSQPGAVVWLMTGETISVEELLKSVIIGNANDATMVLAEHIGGDENEFVGMMNARAFELGMRDTVYKNCAGFDAQGQYSSAYDTALLCRELLNHKFLTKYMTTWMDRVRNDQTELVNENKIVRTYDGLLGFKAGHSEQSGYTLALAAEKDGQTYISVVLGCADKDERFSAGKSLLASGFSMYKVTTPAFSNEFLKPLAVHGGVDIAVEIEARSLTGLVVPKNRDELSSVIFLPEYVEAPVRKGQPVGRVGFYNGDTLLFETDLITSTKVDSMTFLKALKKCLCIMYK
ncbi:D-alanyl-D-alanine carboxypeptidase family protein [Porcipelethomonas sp.]|uniref:D-alanyl-D-alanine carboxypeptidase family protein n=1 Tax=Porcipelethomonas sp. TaxID=2981675 RepID=UPI003EF9ED14